jgi:hypothetical protein
MKKVMVELTLEQIEFIRGDMYIRGLDAQMWYDDLIAKSEEKNKLGHRLAQTETEKVYNEIDGILKKVMRENGVY